MQESIVFLVRVQCRRKESSRSLSHLLMSFLSIICIFCILGMMKTETSLKLVHLSVDENADINHLICSSFGGRGGTWLFTLKIYKNNLLEN